MSSLKRRNTSYLLLSMVFFSVSGLRAEKPNEEQEAAWQKQREEDQAFRKAKIGQPFVLEFEDAITGKNISVAKMQGKIVVVDFWATWCGPCVAEMPKLKGIYEKYHSQGVEVIGVSLDAPKEKGGLDKLLKFVKEKDIPWPQYYQGNGWSSKFSSSWRINGIPHMFVIDQHGKLHATDERASHLEEVLKKLLSAKKGKS